MLLSVFLLIYGLGAVVVAGKKGHTKHELHRHRRGLETLIRKTNQGRATFKTFLPSAAQIGFNRMRRMVQLQEMEKRGRKIKRQSGIGIPLSPHAPASLVASPVSAQIRGTTSPTPVELTTSSANAVPVATAAPINYQYPDYRGASFYNYPYYNSYQYPYYGNNYYPQYTVSKRMFLPYSYGTTYIQQQSPYQYQYPAAFAQVYSASTQSSIGQPVQSNPITATADSTPNTATASGISQGLIDLENDVNGFNEAIQYMKEAFISENRGGSDLHEKIHGKKGDAVNGDKKDLIHKKKTSEELMAAFKRTIQSKQKLESKLVNYFTNYVCGDDC